MVFKSKNAECGFGLWQSGVSSWPGMADVGTGSAAVWISRGFHDADEQNGRSF
jgi:hypothetical protein